MDKNIIALQREINELKKRVDQLKTGGYTPSVFEEYLSISPLRGLWAFNSVKSNFDVIDAAGHDLTLTKSAGGVSFVETSISLFPFIILDGANGYYSRAHESELLLGGMNVIGAWFYINANIATPQSIVGKWVTSGNQRSYVLFVNPSGSGNTPEFAVSGTGSNIIQVGGAQGAPAVTPGVWHFIAGRMTASAELALFYDNQKFVNTTSIPASPFANTSAAFEIGRHDGAANWFAGGIALVFMCNWTMTDAGIKHLYQRTRWTFGV